MRSRDLLPSTMNHAAWYKYENISITSGSSVGVGKQIEVLQ